MNSSGSNVDAIVVGAGHNGLVVAAYLARAGLRVTVVERRTVVGGACVTETFAPGVRFSPCASVISALRPQIIRDLELERFGLQMYAPDVQAFLLRDSGESLFMWPELDRSVKALDALAPGDGDGLVDFGLRMRRFARGMTPYLLEQAPALSEVIAGFEARGEIDLFHDFVLLSVAELADNYFQGELIRGFLAFFALISVYGGPSTPGTAYVLSHHSWGEFEGQFGRAGLARGGMGSITRAMHASAQAAGATIRTEAAVRRIRVRAGRAVGVELEDGDVLEAPIVLSNADPQTTYLSLLDESDVPEDVARGVRAMDMRGSQGRVLLLTSDLPRYVGTPAGEGPQHQGFTLLGGTMDAFERCWQAEQRGELADDYPLEVLIQSVTDPTLAPAGRHTVSIGVQHLPYELAHGTWDEQRDELARRVLATFARFAPNMASSIEEHWTITPLDLERTYGMAKGNIFHGAMTPAQLFASRPFAGSGGARSPIDGLYLCGAGTHPGGAVIGANGHNAARLVLRDRHSSRHAPDRRVRAATSRRGVSFDGAVDRAASSPSLRRLRGWSVRQPWLRRLVRAATRTRQ
jgi:phytoene dehydrogenase-like protein